MLNELDAHPLHTILAPSKRSDRREMDMIRVNDSVPPRWYREFCGRHESKRKTRRGKFDTRIKRANVLSTLRVLSEGRNTPSKYAAELKQIAREIERKSA